MQDSQVIEQGRPVGYDQMGVSYFASQVVSLLAERFARSEAVDPRPDLVHDLVEAAITGTKESFSTLLLEMRRSRISLAALADVYIPMAARQMGQQWHDDQMSWVDVTIGTARLQSLLREIGSAWAADQALDQGQGTVLLIVPQLEQHTLGPMVAMGQMRRFGVSVCLRIAPSFDELRSLVAARSFDGVMISVACQAKLESVAKIVKFLKSISQSPLPVVVGGAVMTSVEDAASCTGADLSSNDIGAALEAIGLKLDAFCALKRA